MLKVLELARKASFWGLDGLKGGNVRRHYRDIKRVQNNPTSSLAKETSSENLSKILEHAIRTVPFYCDIPQEETLTLEKIPIVNKHIVRNKFEQFRSYEFVDQHTHEVLTSGSTGKPFRILHDKNKRDRNTADTIFFAKRAGYDLGSRLFYLRLWDKQYKKNKFLSSLQNIAMYSVDDLTNENISKLVNELERNNSNNNLLIYTSALDSICQYMDKNPERKINKKVNSIIAIAEALGSEVKKKAEKHFGREVLSRYSNSENGILAQQRKGSAGNFEINWASYHIEILDLNEDKPVQQGEPGRIIITDLFNYSMPLIRYDTGDVGVINEDMVHGGLVFSKVEGRKMDMFTNTKGEFISSHIIHHILQFKGIEQFQFVEEENGVYIIKLKVSPEFDKNDENGLKDKYTEYFGQDANVMVKYVNDIPLLPSGKRKLVINNAIQNKKLLSASKTTGKKVDLVH